MTRYAALIDGKKGAYGVVVPDLPGCTAMGKTVDEAIVNTAAAMRDWAQVVVESGGKVPSPRALEDIRSDPEIVEAVNTGATLASVPLIYETGKPIKANLSIDAGVLAAIDAEAARRKLTRSAFIELLARHALPDLAA